jgi:flagellin
MKMSIFALRSNGLASSAYKNLSRIQSNLNSNIGRLSSGLRINSTADDSAGSNVSVRMGNQVRGMSQANRNAQDANNLLATAESGLSDISDILGKMRELSVQASTDTLNDADRASIDLEFQSLKDELTRIANVTEYNGMNVLNGTYQASGSAPSVTPTSDGAVATNRVLNGSFETGDFSDWSIDTLSTGGSGEPYQPWSVTGAGQHWDTQPQDGNFVAWNGFDGGGPMEFHMSQDITISENSTATLSWMDRVQSHIFSHDFKPRLYDVEIRDAATNSVLENVYSFSTDSFLADPQNPSSGTGRDDTGWQTHSVDVSAYSGQNIRVFFREQIPESFTGPAQIEFDAISLTETVAEPDNIRGHWQMQIGADNDINNQHEVSITNATANGLDLEGDNVQSVDDARTAITAIDHAIDEVNRERSYIGSEQNKLQFTMSNLTSSIQSIESSRSSIEDVDFAAEAADLAKNQILAQSGTAMLAQASAISQSILGLLA